jgi:hypothetical protein
MRTISDLEEENKILKERCNRLQNYFVARVIDDLEEKINNIQVVDILRIEHPELFKKLSKLINGENND